MQFIRLSVSIAICFSIAGPLHAQRRGSASFYRKDIHHTVGIQVNELLRQVFNFNGGFNSPGSYVTSNPYLLTYHINSRTCGWGVRTGVGFFYTDEPQSYVSGMTSNAVTDVRARLGLEKAFRIGRRWSTGAAADAVWNYEHSVFESTSFQSIGGGGADTSYNYGRQRSITLGGGLSGWLRYHITPRITVGTETNVYYAGCEQQSAYKTRRTFAGGQSAIEIENNVEEDVRGARISLPVAFFLAVHF